MAKARKRYPNDFRIKVAKEADSGSITDVAKKFKVPENNVYNWRATYRKHGEAGFVGMGKRGPRAGAVRAVNSGQLQKRLERDAGKALSGLLGKAIVDLRSQLAAEQQRRKNAEKVLRIVRGRLQKIIAAVKE